MTFRPDIMQYAWVVPSLELAAKRWHAATGIGPFLVNHDLRLENARHRGQPSMTRFSTALAQQGAIQIELIEQLDDGASVYRDTVPAGATALHHVACIAADFDAAVAHYLALGYAIAADGRFGPMRYAYVDSAADLGHMIEIVEDKPAIRAFFAAVESARDDWDGDPQTLLRPV